MQKVKQLLPYALGVAMFAALLTLIVPSPARAQSVPVVAGTLLASGTRTAATVNTDDQTNTAFRGVQVVVNVSARTSGTYTATIQGKDPASGSYYTILTSAAFNVAGMASPLTVYPGIAAAANSAASTVLPLTWRVQFAGTSTPNMTFSAGVILLP